MNVEVKNLKLLPPHPNKCQVCAVDHEPDMPHDATSLFYQMQFRGRFGRDGTWVDAMAHCTEEMQVMWKEEFIKQHGLKLWSEPPAGVDPIGQEYRLGKIR